MNNILINSLTTDFVSVPKSYNKLPLSFAAKGLLLDLILSETESVASLLDANLSLVNELLTVGILQKEQITIENEVVTQYRITSMPTKTEVTTPLPIVNLGPEKPAESATQPTHSSTDTAFAALYDALNKLEFKSKLPQPNYRKIRSHLQRWSQAGITTQHITEAYKWLLIEKGSSKFLNWWDIESQIWEVKSVQERQQSRASFNPTAGAVKGINPHLHKHQTGSAFINNVHQVNNDIRQIFSYWQKQTNMRGELTLERIRFIRNALNAFNVQELEKAVDGALLNEYCQAKGLLSVADIYRNTDIIAKHIHRASNPNQNSVLSPAEKAIDIALNDMFVDAPDNEPTHYLENGNKGGKS